MVSRVVLASVSLALLLSACGGGDETATSSSSSAKPTGCEEVSSALGEAIAEGGTGELTWERGAAVKSPDHEGAYYVAGVVSDGAGNEVTGIWATTSMTAGEGIILSVDGFADRFTNWPKSDEKTGSMSVADDGAKSAKDCLES